MNSNIEIDYEKQFQDDLVKATAISLEQHALDEYNRTRKYGNRVCNTQKKKNFSATQELFLNNENDLSKKGKTKQMSTEKLQILPQRRFSDVTCSVGLNTTSLSSSSTTSLKEERSKTPPLSVTNSIMDNDLISFSSPRSKNTDHSAFDKLIEDIQKLHTNKPQNTLIVASNCYNRSNTYMQPSVITTGFTCSSGNQNFSNYSQIVAGPAAERISSTFNVQPKKKTPLTNEELERLYSMIPSSSSSSSSPLSFTPNTNDLYNTCKIGYIPFIHGNKTLQNHFTSSYVGLSTNCNSITSTSVSQLENIDIQPNYLIINSGIKNSTGNVLTKQTSQQDVPRKIKDGVDLIDLSQEDE